MSIVGRSRFAVAWLGWCSLLLLAPSPVRAQSEEKPPGKAERSAARDAYDKGTKAFDSGDYVTALDAFVKANALIPSVQAMFWIARCQDLGGKGDAAIEAYETLTGRGDFAKLSQDKQALVHERLAALKPAPVAVVAPIPVVAAPPAVEPAPAPAEAPPAAAPPPPPHEDSAAAPPRAQSLFEAGVTGGPLWASKHSDFAGNGNAAPRLEHPVWELGVRGAIFPLAFLGAEAEWLHGFGRVMNADAPDASYDARAFRSDILRAHAIAQLPLSYMVPFALLGVGFIHTHSGVAGSDDDVLGELGVGVKVKASKLLVPRLDGRLNLTQKEGSGVAVHPELLFGLSFAFGS